MPSPNENKFATKITAHPKWGNLLINTYCFVLATVFSYGLLLLIKNTSYFSDWDCAALIFICLCIFLSTALHFKRNILWVWSIFYTALSNHVYKIDYEWLNFLQNIIVGLCYLLLGFYFAFRKKHKNLILSDTLFFFAASIILCSTDFGTHDSFRGVMTIIFMPVLTLIALVIGIIFRRTALVWIGALLILCGIGIFFLGALLR
jgi:hypothetical protein